MIHSIITSFPLYLSIGLVLTILSLLSASREPDAPQRITGPRMFLSFVLAIALFTLFWPIAVGFVIWVRIQLRRK